MDNKYQELFVKLSHAIEVMAESLESDAALKMRDDFAALNEKCSNNADELNKNDYIKLLIGALAFTNNLKDRITNDTKALNGYKLDILPKLQRMINECENDEQVKELSKELFTTVSETET